MKDGEVRTGAGARLPQAAAAISPSGEELQSVKALYRAGRYLDAWRCSQEIGPLASWRGEEARITAGRLARVLGHQQLAHVCFYRAWKEYPQSSKALYYHARARIGRSGYYRVRLLLEKNRELTDRPGKGHAQWQAFHAMLYSRYRDFERADACIEAALREDPNDAWLHCEYSFVLELEDRYQEALQAIRQAYVIKENYRPALQQEAYLLQLMGHDEEAYELLQRARKKVQSFSLYWQLLDMMMERKAWNQADALLTEIEELSPIRDKYADNWIHARRGEIRYYQGNYPLAIESIARVDSPYYKDICRNLENAIYPPRIKLLQVNFVRQHHDTCGPATMSAILNFLKVEVSQQEIVDSIWYAGTTAYDERKWSLEKGLLVREFALDFDSARQLIDKGIPVALTTEEPDSAHLQALVGYDEARGVFFIRDPYEREYQEFLIDHFLERYAASGPRAFVMLPRERQADLAAIELPQAEQYDALYELKDHLQQHDVEAARETLCDVEQRWPGSRMAAQCTWTLACYESNVPAALQAVDRLQAMYPEDDALQLRRQRLMSNMGQNRERRQLLAESWSGGGNMHQSLLQEYIDLCADDGRDNHFTRELLWDMLRRFPQSAPAYYCLAGIQWDEREFERAIETFRMAACLDYLNESYALAYFKAGRLRGQEKEAMEWLHHRYERHRQRSSSPAITLFRACEFMDQEARGIEFLYKAMERRDDDGDLKLFLLDQLGNLGRLEEAEKLLLESRGKVRESDWLMSRAELLELQQDFSGALAVWQQVTERLPLNVYARERYTRLLASLEGRGSVLAYMRRLVAEHADNPDYHRLLLQWSDDEPPSETEPVFRQLLILDPANVWAHRNLAINLMEQGKVEAALEQLDLAQKIEPNKPNIRILKGDAWRQLGNMQRAAELYREAIALSVDATSAYERLLGCATDAVQRRQDLDFIHQQLVSQTINDDAMLAFRSVATSILSAEEVYEHLHQGWQARPDSWYSWAALIEQCQDMRLFDEAEKYAADAVASFPFLPRLWLMRARNYRLQGDFAVERQHLQKALEINPNYAIAVRQLSENYSNCGEYSEARDLLHHFLKSHQDDSRAHAYLADVLWAMREAELALHHIEQAVRIDPDYPWAWDRLKSWDEAEGEGLRSGQLARELVQRRPGDARAWICLSRVSADTDEALQATRRAIELAPANAEAHQQKLRLLVDTERYEEALKAWEDADSLHGQVEFSIYHPWILRRQGRIDEAVSELQALLQQSPYYDEGWRLLAIWARDNDDNALALQAFARYVELNPGDLDVISDYAALLQAEGENEKALQQLQGAARLQPANGPIVLSLFDLLLDMDRVGEARELMGSMETHLRYTPDGAWVEARLVHLLAREGQMPEAMAQFGRVCRLTENNRWLIDSSIDALNGAGWEEQTSAMLNELMDHLAELGPAVGMVMGERFKQLEEWTLSDERVDFLLQGGEAGTVIVEAWLDYLIDNSHFRDLDRLIRRREQALRSSTNLWGTIGFYYARRGEYDRCCKWMQDWDERDDAPAWALNSLAMSLREKYRFRRSFAVIQQAVELPEDNASDSLRLYAAVESGLRNNWGEFHRWFPLVDPERLNRYDGFIWQLAKAMHHLHSTAATERMGHLRKVRGLVAMAKRDLPEHGRDAVSSIYLLRISYALAGMLGGLPFRLYWWGRIQFS